MLLCGECAPGAAGPGNLVCGVRVEVPGIKVEQAIVIELKTVQQLNSAHRAQCLNYLVPRACIYAFS